jgi:hypothetical protein
MYRAASTRMRPLLISNLSSAVSKEIDSEQPANLPSAEAFHR